MLKKHAPALLLITLLSGCAGQKGAVVSNSKTGDTRTVEVASLTTDTYKLVDVSDDKTYGYEQSNPIKVGGVKEESGPKNERRFMNALLGPEGQPVSYYRAGSCCPFKTPNGLFEKSGMLDIYKVYYQGSKDTLTLYLNMYDKGNLPVPVGFTAKKQTY